MMATLLNKHKSDFVVGLKDLWFHGKVWKTIETLLAVISHLHNWKWWRTWIMSQCLNHKQLLPRGFQLSLKCKQKRCFLWNCAINDKHVTVPRVDLKTQRVEVSTQAPAGLLKIAGNLRVQGLNPGNSRQPLTSGC